MQALVGTTLPVFIGLTVILCGGAAFLAGQAMANGWQPAWKAALYALLITFGDRFLVWGLFQGELLSISGYLVDAAILAAIALFAHRLTAVRKMTSQYPWLYERSGLLGWRERGGAG